jgi:alkylation response protein AidB-like acyl-CoA dehydrogenase
MFRWRASVKSKGKYYEAMAAEMEAIDPSPAETGAETYALAARALNETIMFAHSHKLTKQQYIMLCLADMMTYVEIGVSMARKASRVVKEDAPEARKVVIMSRVFASEVAEVVAKNSMKIIMGSGLLDEQTTSQLKKKIGYEGLMKSYSGLIKDMDAIADILFDRA